jgi:multidrug efflux pump subunit AcrA (membrane-fusion protein)
LRSVEVATKEVGIVTAIRVLEGSRVERGDVLATLDDEVQRALLSIASKTLELRGRYESATAEAELRRQRLQKLESLHGTGHARREEVERAKADLAIAKAQVLAAEEELLLRKLEYDRTAIQESDTVRVRIRIDNQSGEFRSGQRCALLLPD